MPTRNINLTDHFDTFVERRVSSGHYQNASEVVREGLRLLEQREQEDAARLRRLRAAIRAGEEAVKRGEYRDVDADGLADYLAGLGETGRRRRARS